MIPADRVSLVDLLRLRDRINVAEHLVCDLIVVTADAASSAPVFTSEAQRGDFNRIASLLSAELRAIGADVSRHIDRHAGPARHAVTGTPARAIRRLMAGWKAARGPLPPVHELPLSTLLLSGMTESADEGPAVDVLAGVHSTIDGWLRTAAEEDTNTIRVSLSDALLLSRRVEVAAELVRRGAGSFPAWTPPPATPAANDSDRRPAR